MLTPIAQANLAKHCSRWPPQISMGELKSCYRLCLPDASSPGFMISSHGNRRLLVLVISDEYVGLVDVVDVRELVLFSDACRC